MPRVGTRLTFVKTVMIQLLLRYLGDQHFLLALNLGTSLFWGEYVNKIPFYFVVVAVAT